MASLRVLTIWVSRRGVAHSALCCAVALVLGAVPAVAQDEEEPRVELILTKQPVWHEDGDRLGLGFRVVNHGDEELSGFVVTVAAHSRVLSRSELHASFEAAPTFQASLIQVEVPEAAAIPPGDSLNITVDPAVGDLQSLAAATESGVYPLTITLFDESRTTVLDSVTTPLIYYPVETELPLNIALLIPINDIPRQAPDGTFPSEVDGRWPLDAAVSQGGWLDGLISALETTTGRQPHVTDERPTRRSRRGRKRQKPKPPPRPEPLHVGIAPVPRLIEELDDMSDGYTRSRDAEEEVRPGDATATAAGDLLDRLAALLETPGVQPVTTPYSFPDLPALDASPVADHLITQIDEGQTVLNDALGTRPDRSWIFPPGGRLDAGTLEELQRAAEEQGSDPATFLAEDSLEPLTDDPAGAGCPTTTLSFTCPISVETSAGTSRAYALDPSIQQRLFEVASGEDVRLAAQQFFAETSAIREETPGEPGRIVAATLPGLWAPRPGISRVILEGLRDAPWIRTVTPHGGFTGARDLVETRERVIRTSLPPLGNLPEPSYFEDLNVAQQELEHFETVGPPASFVQRLTRNILTAESRLWWGNELEDRGRAYATESLAEVNAERAKISIGSSKEIRLTSRTAPIQIVVFNDADYPVRVRVHLSSSDLDLERTVEETVQARGLKQVRFDISADTSGIFTIQAEVETPDGRGIAATPITIRSTEFNEIALGLTFGALAFLILFYITRTVRQRRHPEQAEA
ncbi:MAG: DUF6049 family protein [Actinomycetota bacterium]